MKRGVKTEKKCGTHKTLKLMTKKELDMVADIRARILALPREVKIVPESAGFAYSYCYGPEPGSEIPCIVVRDIENMFRDYIKERHNK